MLFKRYIEDNDEYCNLNEFFNLTIWKKTQGFISLFFILMFAFMVSFSSSIMPKTDVNKYITSLIESIGFEDINDFYEYYEGKKEITTIEHEILYEKVEEVRDEIESKLSEIKKSKFIFKIILWSIFLSVIISLSLFMVYFIEDGNVEYFIFESCILGITNYFKIAYLLWLGLISFFLVLFITVVYPIGGYIFVNYSYFPNVISFLLIICFFISLRLYYIYKNKLKLINIEDKNISLKQLNKRIKEKKINLKDIELKISGNEEIKQELSDYLINVESTDGLSIFEKYNRLKMLMNFNINKEELIKLENRYLKKN